jgi:hypothetical protein
MAIGWIYAGGAALGAVAGVKGKKQAKKDAAAAEALEWEMTQEELRRMDRDHAQRMGSATTMIGASGAEAGGSSAALMKDIEEEFQRDRAFTEMVGASKAKEAGRVNTIGINAQIGSSILKGIAGVGKGAGWWTG